MIQIALFISLILYAIEGGMVLIFMVHALNFHYGILYS